MRTARSLLGVPYVWLGVYPQDGGMDCASFTWYLYKQLGIDIGFETYDQMYSGVRVFGDPQPGDIILMYYGACRNYNPMLPEHVVLYCRRRNDLRRATFGGRCQYVSLARREHLRRRAKDSVIERIVEVQRTLHVFSSGFLDAIYKMGWFRRSCASAQARAVKRAVSLQENLSITS